MKDPEYRKARTARLRQEMYGNNRGLAEELGLSQYDSDRLFDLLVEQMDERQEYLDGVSRVSRADDQLEAVEINSETFAEFARKREPLLQEQDRQVAALLGPDLYAKWKDYRITAVERGRVLIWSRHTKQRQRWVQPRRGCPRETWKHKGRYSLPGDAGSAPEPEPRA